MGGGRNAGSVRIFVLVHGAWHGGWCWARVRARLTALGHLVFTPTLTGLGERAHLLTPEIDLDTHIEDILAVFRWERVDQAVLCGHSYGGMVVTGVAERIPDRIRSLVYLDAHVPEDGKAMVDYMPEERSRAQLEADARGDTAPLPPIAAARFGVNPADRDWIDAWCTPQPRRTFTTPARLSGAAGWIAKRTYIRAAGYDSPPLDAARARCAAHPGFAIREMACGHDAMVDDPEGLVDLLLEAA